MSGWKGVGGTARRPSVGTNSLSLSPARPPASDCTERHGRSLLGRGGRPAAAAAALPRHGGSDRRSARPAAQRTHAHTHRDHADTASPEIDPPMYTNTSFSSSPSAHFITQTLLSRTQTGTHASIHTSACAVLSRSSGGESPPDTGASSRVLSAPPSQQESSPLGAQN